LATILAAVFAALLAGIFALIGALYGGRREHDKWLRDARREAYERLLASVLQLRAFYVRTDIMAGASTVQFEPQLSAFMSAYGDISSALSAVKIAGPATVTDAATELAEVARRYGNRVVSDDAKGRAIAAAEDRFASLARQVLGGD
jgi:hypothetical protein